jgi:uncharacterized membrane protein
MTHSPALPNTIEKSIDIHAPLSTVYNQWTQFEDYPKFLEGVLDVAQLNETRLRWRALIGGQEREWESAIVEQTPDTRIAWRSTGGPASAGMVSFTTVYGGTRVTLQMTLDPEELPREAEEAKGFLAQRVDGNLKRFKEFIESRGSETGGWRGEIHGGLVEHDLPDDHAEAARAGPDQP